MSRWRVDLACVWACLLLIGIEHCRFQMKPAPKTEILRLASQDDITRGCTCSMRVMSSHSQFRLGFAQQRHIVCDRYRHRGFLGLLLDESPLDTEIVIRQHAIFAEAG